jgi:hypothetical protein
MSLFDDRRAILKSKVPGYQDYVYDLAADWWAQNGSKIFTSDAQGMTKLMASTNELNEASKQSPNPDRNQIILGIDKYWNAPVTRAEAATFLGIQPTTTTDSNPPAGADPTAPNADYDPNAMPEWFTKYVASQDTKLGEIGERLKSLGVTDPAVLASLGELNTKYGDIGTRLGSLENKPAWSLSDIQAVIDTSMQGIPVPMTPEDLTKLISPLIASGKMDPNSPDFANAIRTVVSGTLANDPKYANLPNREELGEIFRTELGKASGTLAADYMDSIKTLLPALNSFEEDRLNKFFPGWQAARAGLGAYAASEIANLPNIKAVPDDVRNEMLSRATALGKLSDTALEDLGYAKITDPATGKTEWASPDSTTTRVPKSLQDQFSESYRSAAGVRGLGTSPNLAFDEAIGRSGLAEQYRQSRIGEASSTYGIPYGAHLQAGQDDSKAKDAAINRTMAILGIPIPTSPTTVGAPQFGQMAALGQGVQGGALGLGQLGLAQQGLDLQRAGLTQDASQFRSGLGAGQSSQLGSGIGTILGGLGGFALGGPLGAYLGAGAGGSLGSGIRF